MPHLLNQLRAIMPERRFRRFVDPVFAAGRGAQLLVREVEVVDRGAQHAGEGGLAAATPPNGRRSRRRSRRLRAVPLRLRLSPAGPLPRC
eukprot:365563-Chlamydomonas_euryale.AAC.7